MTASEVRKIIQGIQKDLQRADRVLGFQAWKIMGLKIMPSSYARFMVAGAHKLIRRADCSLSELKEKMNEKTYVEAGPHKSEAWLLAEALRHPRYKPDYCEDVEAPEVRGG